MSTARAWSFEPATLCDVCSASNRRLLGVRTGQPLSQSLRVDLRAPHTSVYECRECGLIYCDPRPSGESVEAVYGTVDDYFAIPIDQARIDFYARLAKNIADVQGGYGRMLDVGCGRGEFVYAASQIGWDAHGIDPDSHFPEFARQRFGLKTVRSLPLSDIVAAGEKFDALSLNAVLEHIPRPLDTMQQAAQVVRPGGTVFIEVPHGHILRFWAADLMLRVLGNPSTTHLSPFHPPFHLYEFSRKAVAVLLGKTGFDVVRAEFWPGSNRVPVNTLSARVKRLLYGALVAAENLSGRTYNLHVYARRLTTVPH